MTHAVVALAQGDWRRAYRHNRFVFVLLPLLGWAILDALARFGELKESRLPGLASKVSRLAGRG